jgi:hypothetical protein
MIRLVRVCGVFVGALMVGLPSMATSGAATEPGTVRPHDIATDDPAPAACTFTLSPPARTRLGSVDDAVTATLKPASCSGEVQPSRSTVCLAFGDSAGNCSSNFAWNTAQVFSGSLPAGTEFTVTGTGCWNGFKDEDWGCTTVGPITAAT